MPELLRVVLLLLFIAAATGDALYLQRVGRPRRYPDRLIGWFMTSIGWAAMGSHVTLAMIAGGWLHGMLAGWLVAAATAVHVGAIWFRVRMSYLAAPLMRGESE